MTTQTEKLLAEIKALETTLAKTKEAKEGKKDRLVEINLNENRTPSTLEIQFAPPSADYPEPSLLMCVKHTGKKGPFQTWIKLSAEGTGRLVSAITDNGKALCERALQTRRLPRLPDAPPAAAAGEIGASLIVGLDPVVAVKWDGRMKVQSKRDFLVAIAPQYAAHFAVFTAAQCDKQYAQFKEAGHC